MEQAERGERTTGDRAQHGARADDAGDDSLAALGEVASLGRIIPRLTAADAALVGPGDDAAVLAAADGRYVVTTDLMVHGPDFRMSWSTPFELGWKAAATNLTDVAAMGARPTALVVAIAAPPDTRVQVLEGIADGLRDALAELAPGAGVVGGDLSVSSVFTIAVTAFGDLEGRSPVLRSGARPGDVIAHAGARGDAARGLALLFGEATDASGEPDPEATARVRAEHPDLVRAQLAPAPPVSAGVIAATAGATAMLDVSDGLARDALRVARASGVDLDFASERLGPDPRIALAGAEDHGLLATFPPGVVIPAPFQAIGRVVAGDGAVRVDGEVAGAGGWDPYAGWDGRAG
ncbi:thiamine-phosphate kinase [Agromyces aerolatus]|uniref:thiamine-phosphate kinase n=1 Tax=Agromyces sp. LY-1074 TaxID=3074080 RepID=UPI00285804F6|nr:MULTISPECIES: thiamine-phosphate kinase [unclassified Agromyces]MDR5699994.1 thiamine-phosphate kinase [Agromyces sp. LY-1074]MDR5706194.1 thiamine-phosphate kinase [Agromyces sp. LY-1358]